MRSIIPMIPVIYLAAAHSILLSESPTNSFNLKFIRSPNKTCELVKKEVNYVLHNEDFVVFPAAHDHHGSVDIIPRDVEYRESEVIEITTADQFRLNQILRDECSAIKMPREDRDLKSIDEKVYQIIHSGDPKNRIDVVFMGDGYTKKEEFKFVKDIQRLVDDMWSDTTFASYVPLFNVWAVFKPSKESGIGVMGKPRDTSFGLYRDGTELRGIYCSKPREARKTCKRTGEFACDFPSLIANDDFYGGLGGEFTIATRSETSGTIVLRHEMGHNFIRVGEEYDGGWVYSGVNSARGLNVPWSKWLTQGPAREQRLS